LSPELAAGIRRVKGVRRLGVRVGNWLTAEQGKRLLDATMSDTLRSKRNRAMLSLLIGCGLRRAELLGLAMSSIQLREEHWVIADLVGKGGHIRTVPIPLWVKRTVDSWTESAHITTGRVFRAINKAGRIWGDGMTPKVLWEVVKNAAIQPGLRSLHLMISGAPAHVCVISPAMSWIRSSFSSGTFPSKPQSATSAASRNSGLR
jgi:site-specific recombinase XerD